MSLRGADFGKRIAFSELTYAAMPAPGVAIDALTGAHRGRRILPPSAHGQRDIFGGRAYFTRTPARSTSRSTGTHGLTLDDEVVIG